MKEGIVHTQFLGEDVTEFWYNKKLMRAFGHHDARQIAYFKEYLTAEKNGTMDELIAKYVPEQK